jgi:hypothetical protein
MPSAATLLPGERLALLWTASKRGDTRAHASLLVTPADDALVDDMLRAYHNNLAFHGHAFPPPSVKAYRRATAAGGCYADQPAYTALYAWAQDVTGFGAHVGEHARAAEFANLDDVADILVDRGCVRDDDDDAFDVGYDTEEEPAVGADDMMDGVTDTYTLAPVLEHANALARIIKDAVTRRAPFDAAYVVREAEELIREVRRVETARKRKRKSVEPTHERKKRRTESDEVEVKTTKSARRRR